MKNAFLLPLFLLGIIFSARAQNFNLGIKAGANLTKIDGVKFKDGFNTSYQAGGFLILDINDKWGIQPEILFTQSTARQDTSMNQLVQFNNMGDIRLNYLTIPLLLKYNATKMLSVHIGPQFGILLNKDENLLQNGKRAFKGGDFSMLAGLQLNIKAFKIYGRYNIGLSNLSDVASSGKWKYSQIQLGVGFVVF